MQLGMPQRPDKEELKSPCPTSPLQNHVNMLKYLVWTWLLSFFWDPTI